MHPTELWWLIEGKMPPRRIGSMTEPELDSLWEEMKQMEGFASG